MGCFHPFAEHVYVKNNFLRVVSCFDEMLKRTSVRGIVKSNIGLFMTISIRFTVCKVSSAIKIIFFVYLKLVFVRNVRLGV